MSLGHQQAQQQPLWMTCNQLPRSQGHPFYERLQAIFREHGFDAFVETLCEPFYAGKGRPSIPPGRYFRMLFVGYFEGLDSERQIAWRCQDSLTLRDFIGVPLTASAPDHSSMTRIRQRLPLEVHQEVFVYVLGLLDEGGLLSGKYLGVDSSLMAANAALKKLTRKDTGEDYQEMLKRLARESGTETPTREDLVALDRKRKGKKLSNAEWESGTDGDARIAKMKDGTTHLAYKPEHVVDLESGAIVSLTVHPADQGDTKTLAVSLQDAESKLLAVKGKDWVPSAEHPAEVVADKGYHSRDVLKNLPEGFRSRISEPAHKGQLRWKGDKEAQRAVYGNRERVHTPVGKALLKARGERVERSFAHCPGRGGMRRVWLRGTENIEKRYAIHVAGFNLGLLMRSLFGVGTPRSWADAPCELFLTHIAGKTCLILAIWPPELTETPILPVLVRLEIEG